MNANVCVRDGEKALLVFGDTLVAVVTRDKDGRLTVGARQHAQYELITKPISVPKDLVQLILGMAALTNALNQHPHIGDIKREIAEASVSS